MTTEIAPGPDGRWRHPDGNLATDDEAAEAIWGTPTPLAESVRDDMAKAMCAVETRSKAATLEEVQAGIQRWTRHRYEAERLIAELADYGLEVSPRGTVTDAEVEAAGHILGMDDGMEHWIDRDSVITALEAAREARS